MAQTAAPAATSPAVDPRSLQLAHDILDLTNPPADRERIMRERLDGILDRVSASMAAREGSAAHQVSSDFSTIMDSLVTQIMPQLADYYDAIAHAYTRQFTVAELEQIRTFAMTPAGRRFVSIGTVIYKDPDVIAAQQRMTDRMMATVLRKLPGAGTPANPQPAPPKP